MQWRRVASRAAAIAVLGAAPLRVEAAPGPIRVSQSGRYFVDAQDAVLVVKAAEGSGKDGSKN